MTPDVTAVYDAYPTWFGHLLNACAALNALPLEEMQQALTRMTLVGTWIGPGHSEPVDPISVARQQRLIELAIGFRDTLRVDHGDSNGHV